MRFGLDVAQQRMPWAELVRRVRLAEDLGFDYGLAPARFIASHGWELQQEAVTCTAILAAQTKRLKLISAVHTSFWHPAMVAKMGATIDVYSKGRFAINAVCKHVRLDGDIHQQFGGTQHRGVFLTTLHNLPCRVFGRVCPHFLTTGINHSELISNQFHAKYGF